MKSSPTWALFQSVEGLRKAKSRFHSGPALWIDRTEIAHAHSDGSVDLRLTKTSIRKMRRELQGSPSVRLRPSASSDWIEVKLQTFDAERFLLDLIELAIDQNRAMTGTPARPVPKRSPHRKLV